MEVFDKDGNLVEGVMTAEEVQAKIDAEKAAWQKQTAPVVTPNANEEVLNLVKSLSDKVEKLSGNQTTFVTKDIANTLDDEKKAVFETKFQSLSGYEETPEGIQKRAQDAYLLTTGQQYEVKGINMQNINAVNGAPVTPTMPKAQVDEAFKSTFGISDADVQKYGNK